MFLNDSTQVHKNITAYNKICSLLSHSQEKQDTDFILFPATKVTKTHEYEGQGRLLLNPLNRFHRELCLKTLEPYRVSINNFIETCYDILRQ